MCHLSDKKKFKTEVINWIWILSSSYWRSSTIRSNNLRIMSQVRIIKASILKSTSFRIKNYTYFKVTNIQLIKFLFFWTNQTIACSENILWKNGKIIKICGFIKFFSRNILKFSEFKLKIMVIIIFFHIWLQYEILTGIWKRISEKYNDWIENFKILIYFLLIFKI